MLNRRHALLLGASAAIGGPTRQAEASLGSMRASPARLVTGMLNFKEDVSPERTAQIVTAMRHAARTSGAQGFMIGQNLSPQPFPTRFEWIYMIQFRPASAEMAKSAAALFRDEHVGWVAYVRNEVACDLACPLPPRFASGAGIKVRHTVMFDFKPDAPTEARERNVAAIRRMGELPTVQRYLVQPSASPTPDSTQMQWQVVGDFANLADFRAYLDAPVHLAIRDDFTAHTSRVAFIDVEL